MSSYIDIVYPQWSSDPMIALYHINRAAMSDRWDIIEDILEYYNGKDTFTGMKVYALHTARVFNKDDFAQIVYTKYGITDTYISPAGIYYQYLFGAKPPLRDVWNMIDKTSAENLMGFIHTTMRNDLLTSKEWYFFETDRPKVADVIYGNYDNISYISLVTSPPRPISTLTYGQILSSAFPGNTGRTNMLTASSILSIISRSKVVTMDMVYACLSLLRRHSLFLPQDANPVMIEHLPNYIDVVDDNTARQLAIQLSKASPSFPEEEEYEIVE
jgi:hypothetical protein